MPPSPRYTVRLPPALDALVQARVRAGTPFTVLIREALSAYLADTPPTPAPTPADIGMPTQTPTPAASADTLRNLQQQLTELGTRVEALEQALTRRRHAADTRAETHTDSSADTPPTRPADRPPTDPLTGADTPLTPSTTYDPITAFTRIEALRAEGLSLAKIAAQLNAEGVPTRRGQPWGKALVGWFLDHDGT